MLKAYSGQFLLPDTLYSAFNKNLQHMLEGKEKYSLKKQSTHDKQNKIWQRIGNYQTGNLQ